MSGKSQVKVYLPEELHELLNADSRSNSEAVEAALWREFGGHKKSALESRIEEKRERINTIENEIENREEELSEQWRELRAFKSKLEGKEGEEEERHTACVELLETMERTGKYVFVDHEDIAELAREHFDNNREEALNQLMNVNETENYNMDAKRFGK